MKFTFLINQAGVVRLGLLGQVNLPDLCVLDYLAGWFFCPKAKRAVREGREFVWVRYEHAVEELPLLFNPSATLETRKNQLSGIVQHLREARLIETMKVGRNLFLRPSDLAVALANFRERIIAKSGRTNTPARDDTITQSEDDTVTSEHDDLPPANIDQTTIREESIREEIPHSPPSGERACSTVNILWTQEEDIYALYPKKVGRPAALRSIRRAIGRHTFAVVLERTRLYAQTYRGEPRFIPNPSTFFRQDRFLDDPSTWCRTGCTKGGQPVRNFAKEDYRQAVENF